MPRLERLNSSSLPGKQAGLFLTRRQKALMRKPSLGQQADGTEMDGEKREGKGAHSREGELSFWEYHRPATRPRPLFDRKQEDSKAIMNNWHLNASYCPPLSTVQTPPWGKMQFSSLECAHASVLIPETFCFTILHLHSGSWCLANSKHTMTKHDSLGDANSVLEKGGKTSKWDMVSDETRSPQILMRYPHTWTHSGGVRRPKYRNSGSRGGRWIRDRNISFSDHFWHDWEPLRTYR